MSPFGGSKPKTPKQAGEQRIPAGIFAELLANHNSRGKTSDTEEFPLLPLRELVIFPQTMMSVYVTYKSGINALEEALGKELRLFAVCQKDAESGETWDAGTVVRIVQNLRLPDNTFRVVLQGEYRAILASSKLSEDSTLVRVAPIKAAASSQDTPESEASAQEIAALMRAVQKSFAQYAEFSKKISTEIITAVEKTDSGERLGNLIGNVLAI